MSPEQKAAYVNAQAACVLAEMAGMQAHNEVVNRLGRPSGSTLFTPEDFLNLPTRYGIHHNAVVGFFQE